MSDAAGHKQEEAAKAAHRGMHAHAVDHPTAAALRLGDAVQLLQPLRSLLDSLSRQPWLQRLGARLNRLAELGTDGYPPEIKLRLMILNFIAYLVAASTFVYAVQQSFLDFHTYLPVILINLALIPTALFVPIAHRFNDIAGGMTLLTAECIALFAFTAYLGTNSGIHLQYFAMAAAPFVVLGLERIRLIVGCIIAALTLHIVASFNFPPEAALIKAEQEILDSLYTQAAITTMGILAATVWYAFRLVERARAETDNLLRNILPQSVVDRLKARPGQVIADNFENASVLFADISGFVPLSRALGPARVVELLNLLVSRFDSLAAEHGVEKIKTIGDAYMVAAGVPEPVPDHAERLARMAVSMQTKVEELAAETGHDLRIRIGMACGPLMAGVIGTRKFSYDVWGDTVNLAARLEAAGAAGRIHVCCNTYEVLCKSFSLERHGTIDIKGVGAQETWFLISERKSQI
ncbi:MAG: hypothetical protein RLZ98_1921 [Pseudomonadota bacterium]|jgi:adenylate cyclase